MKKRLLTAVLSTGLFFTTAMPNVASAAVTYRSRARYYRHKRRVRTAKRVGIGAAGGAAVGAIAGGGKGAGIGAAAGAGAGYLYDRHKRHERRR
ncbi:MAG TPA: YMGG-like glycine zipper-containing protein [Candidatus Sulfopaludibacter sp.]|nr:YMGG-like glycine zipper-containing protein [Candidatus Sulfopaludibacter sp.]